MSRPLLYHASMVESLESEQSFEDIPDDFEITIDEDVVDPDAADVEEAPPTADQSLRYFGADFDVDGLVRRLRAGDLTVPSFDPMGDAGSDYEGFQRRFVWPKKQMDRFVESLLLGYPVPGIFLVELRSRRYLVLDGQQRLRTLRAFYDGRYGPEGREKVFRLQYVGNNFLGKTIESLSPSDRRLLDNTFLQATIVVPRTESDKSSVYRLFERINSSGIKLQPQEIRVALYSGPIMHFLRDLNQSPGWRAMFGPAHSRLKDHELILRYLALTEVAETLRRNDWSRERAQASGAFTYKPPMSTFLNAYLDERQSMSPSNMDTVRGEFERVTQMLNAGPGRSALRLSGTQVNAAFTDSVLVGATIAMRDGRALTPEMCTAIVENLQQNEDYRTAVSESTSHFDSVLVRLRMAVTAFSAQS